MVDNTPSGNIVTPGAGRTQATLAVIPKSGLAPPDCQRLGKCLVSALSTLQATEDRTAGQSGINDLMNGEMPKSLVLRAIGLYRQMKKTFGEKYSGVRLGEVTEAAKNLFAGNPIAEICDLPAVHLTLVVAADEADESIISRLLALLPAELVSGVRRLRA
jgi:hypothetical protein